VSRNTVLKYVKNKVKPIKNKVNMWDTFYWLNTLHYQTKLKAESLKRNAELMK